MNFFRRNSEIENRARARRKFLCPRSRSLGSRPARAFTLLEVMLAVVIFTMVVAAIYSSWLLILRATKVGEEATAQVQRRRMAVWTIEHALMCVQSFQASVQYYTFVVQNGDDPLLSFTARLPDDFPRSGEFGGLDMRRVTFSVEQGPNSENDLVVRQNPVLMDLSKDEEEHPLVLARNVEKFEVDCWDPATKDWSDEWNNTNQIPTLLRYKLVLGGEKNNDFNEASPTLSVTRIVAIPSVPVPAQVQRPGGFPGGGFRPPGVVR